MPRNQDWSPPCFQYNSDMIQLTTTDGAIILPIKVVPGASRTRCAGLLDGRLKVAVAAPPEKGRANAELIKFLAAALGLRKRDVTVVDGLTDPRKLVRIENTTPSDIRAHLDLDAP